jgi:hypothetical protein
LRRSTDTWRSSNSTTRATRCRSPSRPDPRPTPSPVQPINSCSNSRTTPVA